MNYQSIKKVIAMKIATLGLAFLALNAGAHNNEHIQQQSSDNQSTNTKLIVLIRHAEKGPSPKKDPQLSPAGKLRAQTLISSLKEIPLSKVLASQFTRTQATVTPIALQRALTVDVIPVQRPLEEYLALMQQTIVQATGNVLIAGHSNTVPMLIKAFGGPEVPAINEQEYGGLYLLKYPYTQKSDLMIKTFGK